jgi:hypothetical protein
MRPLRRGLTLSDGRQLTKEHVMDPRLDAISISVMDLAQWPALAR